MCVCVSLMNTVPLYVVITFVLLHTAYGAAAADDTNTLKMQWLIKISTE